MIGHRLSLRARLTLWYGGMVAAVLVSFGLFWYWSVRQELYHSLEQSLGQVAQTVGFIVERAHEQGWQPLRPLQHSRSVVQRSFSVWSTTPLRGFVGPLPSDTLAAAGSPVWSAVYQYILLNPRTYSIQIADTAGHIIWRSANLLEDSLPVLRLSRVGERRVLRVWLRGEEQQLLVYRSTLAEVAVGYNVREIEAVLQRLGLLLLWAIPLVLAIAGFGGWVLARASLRPVDMMRRTAESITAHNLSLRIPEPPTEDELAHLARTLNQMIARLEASFMQIRQFSADVSHELRTPLTILIGELELALRSRKRPEEYEAVLSSALEEVLRLHRIVETLFELARAERGQLPLDQQPVLLAQLIEEIAEDVEPLARERGIAIYRRADSDGRVLGDALRLRQAVLNVVDNALKYTPAGGSVTLSLYSASGEVVVEVADTGVGIAPEDMPHVFERFYRAEKSRSRTSADGAGLGLAIVRWIVEAHGGRVELDSRLGGGTRVRLCFPELRDEEG